MHPSTSFRNRFERSDTVTGARQNVSAIELDLTSEELALLRTWRIARAARHVSVNVEPVIIGDIVIDRAAHAVSRNGEPVGLSPKEYNLLLALAVRSNTAVSREHLMREVWNDEAPATSRTLDQHISQLRKKIEDNPAHPDYIVTVSKYGYRLSARRMRIDKA